MNRRSASGGKRWLGPWWQDFRRDAVALVIFILVLALGYVIFASIRGASAQTFKLCQQRTELLQKVPDHLAASGITRSGSLVEIFADGRGAWAVVITVPRQLPCIVSEGMAWESYAIAEERGT